MNVWKKLVYGNVAVEFLADKFLKNHLLQNPRKIESKNLSHIWIPFSVSDGQKVMKNRSVLQGLCGWRVTEFDQLSGI